MCMPRSWGCNGSPQGDFLQTLHTSTGWTNVFTFYDGADVDEPSHTYWGVDASGHGSNNLDGFSPVCALAVPPALTAAGVSVTLVLRYHKHPCFVFTNCLCLGTVWFLVVHSLVASHFAAPPPPALTALGLPLEVRLESV